MSSETFDTMPCDTMPPGADVRWPVLPAGVTAALGLTCEACGYALKLSARRRPLDFDHMVGDFLTRHGDGACRAHAA